MWCFSFLSSPFSFFSYSSPLLIYICSFLLPFLTLSSVSIIFSVLLGGSIIKQISYVNTLFFDLYGSRQIYQKFAFNLWWLSGLSLFINHLLISIHSSSTFALMNFECGWTYPSVFSPWWCFDSSLRPEWDNDYHTFMQLSHFQSSSQVWLCRWQSQLVGQQPGGKNCDGIWSKHSYIYTKILW